MVARNDKLIFKLLKDKNYAIFPDGRITTRVAPTGKVYVDPRRWRDLSPQVKNASVVLKYQGKTLTLSRVIYAAYGSEKLKPDLTIKHLDGNFRNNSVDNLKPMTQAENNLYSFRVLKRKPVFGNTVLTWEIVREIRRLKKELNLSHKKIGSLYKISKGHVSEIVNNNIWREENEVQSPS